MTTLPYYLFYFFVILFVSLTMMKSQTGKINYNNERIIYIKKFYILISFIFAWGVAGLRYNVGSDYYSYIGIYNDIGVQGLRWALSTLRTEPLYALLNWLIYQIFDSHELVFIITSFIVLTIVYTVIIRQKEFLNVGIAIFLFMIVYYFPNFTFIRLSIAVSIILYSYRFIVDKNFKKYLITIFIAMGFHYTAIIMLPMYFLVNKFNKHKILKYIFVMFIILFFVITFQWLAEYLLSGLKYEVYNTQFGNFQGGVNQLILHVPLALLVLVFKERLTQKNKENAVYIQIFLTGSLLMLFTLWVGIIDRMLIYFLISQLIIVPQIFRVLKRKEKPLFIFLIFSYFLIRFIYYLSSNPGLFPYQTIIGV